MVADTTTNFNFKPVKGDGVSEIRLKLSYALAENARLKARIGEINLQLVEKNMSIPGDMLRRIVQLVHPDKHDGSLAANEVMQFLNKLRG